MHAFYEPGKPYGKYIYHFPDKWLYMYLDLSGLLLNLNNSHSYPSCIRVKYKIWINRDVNYKMKRLVTIVTLNLLNSSWGVFKITFLFITGSILFYENFGHRDQNKAVDLMTEAKYILSQISILIHKQNAWWRYCPI